MRLSDLKPLVRRWDRSSYRSRAQSIRYHHRRHGGEQSLLEYLDGAANFPQERAAFTLRSDGTVLWTLKKQKRFLITRDALIVTYGDNP